MTALQDAQTAHPDAPSAAMAALNDLLVDGEKLIAVALQHRLFALLHRRQVVAVTSGRFIYLSRRLFGGFDPVSVRLQDLKDARMNVGMLSATLSIEYNANMSDTAADEGDAQVITVTGLVKAPAAAVYRACQAEEQAWREKRRVRSMEEMRARSGGVQIATGVQSAQSPLSIGGRPIDAAQGPTERLAHAKDLLDQHLITDAEYQEIKAKIIGLL